VELVKCSIMALWMMVSFNVVAQTEIIIFGEVLASRQTNDVSKEHGTHERFITIAVDASYLNPLNVNVFTAQSKFISETNNGLTVGQKGVFYLEGGSLNEYENMGINFQLVGFIDNNALHTRIDRRLDIFRDVLRKQIYAALPPYILQTKMNSKANLNPTHRVLIDIYLHQNYDNRRVEFKFKSDREDFNDIVEAAIKNIYSDMDFNFSPLKVSLVIERREMSAEVIALANEKKNKDSF
jgi:hypothetical protein